MSTSKLANDETSRTRMERMEMDLSELSLLSPTKSCVSRSLSNDSGVHLGTRVMPNYSVNIYETLMIFTLNVSMVDPVSLLYEEKEERFGVSFRDARNREFELHTQFRVNANDVDMDNTEDHEWVESEVWDNNVLLKVAVKPNWDAYRVAVEEEQLTHVNWIKLPKFNQIGSKKRSCKKSTTTPSNTSASIAPCIPSVTNPTSNDENVNSISSHRSRSSGSVIDDAITPAPVSFTAGDSDSDDSSLLSSSPSLSSQTIVEVNAVRGILKGSQSSSQLQDQKSDNIATLRKSVSFSERVQRYTFRANSSILGQRHKNQHKRAQKSRRQQRLKMQAQDEDHEEDEKKRSNTTTSKKREEHCKGVHHEEDSGVASSMEECEASGLDGNTTKPKRSRKAKKRCVASQNSKQEVAQNNDLMFDIDFD